MGAPGIRVQGGTSPFRPHFDYQLGRHFDSFEEKKAALKEMNLVQYSGPASPDADDRKFKGRPEMSRSQFLKWRGKLRTRPGRVKGPLSK
jgi:hypothetical protein